MIDISNITIGVDIDDVIYQTSKMIEEVCISYFKENDIPYEYNPNKYPMEEKFKIPLNVLNKLYDICDWANEKYINSEAITALQRMQKLYNAKLVIITARNEKSTYKLLQLLHNTSHFQVQDVYCAANNKCDIANNAKCDIMLDDYTENIISFNESPHCKPILVSSQYTIYNKEFAKIFKPVLNDWNSLEEIVRQTLNNEVVYA